MSEKEYKGDLYGRPCRHASSVAVGTCRDGATIGIDLLDEAGETIGHAHFDSDQALELAEGFLAELDRLVERENRAEDPDA